MSRVEQMENGMPSMVADEHDAVLVMRSDSTMTLMVPSDPGAPMKDLPPPHRVLVAFATRLKTEKGRFADEMLAWLDKWEAENGEIPPDQVMGVLQ